MQDRHWRGTPHSHVHLFPHIFSWTRNLAESGKGWTIQSLHGFCVFHEFLSTLPCARGNSVGGNNEQASQLPDGTVRFSLWTGELAMLCDVKGSEVTATGITTEERTLR